MLFIMLKNHQEKAYDHFFLCFFAMQVKDCVLRTRKGMVISGIEALSVAMLLQMGRTVWRQVFNTAQEFQDRQSGLQPLLDMVGLYNLEFLFIYFTSNCSNQSLRLENSISVFIIACGRLVP